MQAEIPQGVGRVALTKLVLMAHFIRKVQSMVIDGSEKISQLLPVLGISLRKSGCIPGTRERA